MISWKGWATRLAAAAAEGHAGEEPWVAARGAAVAQALAHRSQRPLVLFVQEKEE